MFRMAEVPLSFAGLAFGFVSTLLLIMPRPGGLPIRTGPCRCHETPVSGADVSLGDGDARVSTGPDGRFSITNLSPGVYAVHVVRLGYEDFTIESVAATPAGDSPLRIALSPAALRLSEITVSPGTLSFGGSSPSARQTMSRTDVDAVPQFAEDIFRAVNRLPGLTSGDFSSRFRGGRPDETLIRIDGLEIYEPYHLKDFNDGAISIIDSETIEGVETTRGLALEAARKRDRKLGDERVREQIEYQESHD